MRSAPRANILRLLDNAAFGAALACMTPKFISRSDPAAQWTGAHKGHAFFAYAANYLIDTEHGVIVDVEATRAIRQAEVGAARTMLERTETRFGIKPVSPTADSAYGSRRTAWHGWSKRKILPRTSRSSTSPTERTARFPAPTSLSILSATVTPAPRAKSWSNSDAPTPSPEAASQPRAQDSIAPANWIATSARSWPRAAAPNAVARKIPRDLNEDSRDIARALASTPEYETACRRRRKIEMLFAHLKRIFSVSRACV